MTDVSTLTRRRFLQCAATAAAVGSGAELAAQHAPRFKLRYVLSTSIYGNLPIDEIAAQMRPAGCDGLDIWAGRWGNQREQVEKLGPEATRALLRKHDARVSCYTCMDCGFLKAAPHMKAMKAFGGDTIVANLTGVPRGGKLQGADLAGAVKAVAENLKPAIAVAGEVGVKLAIENHSGGLLLSADAIERLAAAIPDRHVGIALAPYHLPQDGAALGQLVGRLGERLLFFYAWQHGDGSGELPPEGQRKQLPGVGPLDFKPMLAALRRMNFSGWTSIFMHPTPRGSSMHPTATETTAELNRARGFLDAELARA